jgi:hypothetical protein
MGRRRTELLLVLAALVGAGAGCGRASAAKARLSAANALRVPRATRPVRIDGEMNEADWPAAAVTGAFVDVTGQPVAPHSEARFLWSGRTLFLGLYAADENIQSATDAFRVELEAENGERLAMRLGPTGSVSPWAPGVRVGHDTDGTIDDVRDDDEEWIVETAVPLERLGLGSKGGRVAVYISRCDTPKDGIERCGSYAGVLALE